MIAAKNENFYIPSLDGVRALSFTFVFLGHAGMGRYLPGGFGVTVFFFLSGFLITSLLRREHEINGAVSLKNFYTRRVLRIFPPLYISLLLMAFLTPGHIKPLAVGSQIVFMTNYYLLYDFSGFPTGSGVVWSLAVEEHFYLIFPLVFLIIGKWPKTAILKTILASCFAFLVWRWFLFTVFNVSSWHLYSASDTRMDSILFGCLLALCCNPILDKRINFGIAGHIFLYVIPLLLLLFTFLYRSEEFRGTLRYTLQGIALLPLFYLVIVDHDKPWFKWLNCRAVRFLGVMSYTMYLLHHCVILTVETFASISNPVLQGIACFIICVLLAYLMYLLIEKPITVFRQRLRAVKIS